MEKKVMSCPYCDEKAVHKKKEGLKASVWKCDECYSVTIISPKSYSNSKRAIEKRLKELEESVV